MKKFEKKLLPRGEVIISEGELSNDAFILLKGEVKIHKKRKDGQYLTLDTITPGQLFGEMALFSSSARTASAVAITDVELKVINKEQFQKLFLKSAPEIRVLLILMAERLKKTTALASDLSFEAQMAKFDDMFTEEILQNIIFPE